MDHSVVTCCRDCSNGILHTATGRMSRHRENLNHARLLEDELVGLQIVDQIKLAQSAKTFGR